MAYNPDWICPYCGWSGEVHDGKFLGVEDEAYCAHCGMWMYWEEVKTG